MRIAIMGAGGVGGFFGGRLALAGHEVCVIARGKHLAALRQAGLMLESADQPPITAPITAHNNAREIGPVDVVLFCVKLYDTALAARTCRPLMRGNTVLISLQNGVDAIAMIARELKKGILLAGAAYVAAHIARPGVIRQTGPAAFGWFTFGMPGDTPPPAATDFSQLCAAGGLRAELSGDIARTLWEKFILVSANSALCGLSRQPLGVVRADARLRQKLIAAIAETAAVGRACGVGLDEDIEARTLDTLDHAMGGDTRASLLIDLERGRPLELDWLSGAVCRLGEKTGVATPLHSEVYAALAPFAAGR
jgi:2-dehydropantoate 2-reductase